MIGMDRLKKWQLADGRRTWKGSTEIQTCWENNGVSPGNQAGAEFISNYLTKEIDYTKMHANRYIR